VSGDARTRNVWRRWGYRLLPGDGFSYVLHLRPAEWPIMAAHTALGFLLALGVVPVLHGERLGTLLGALVLWVVFLNGGTLAVNSVYDKDEGDIGYLRSPPAPPAHLLGFSLALLAAGQLLAFALPRGFVLVYFACALMSVAYSVPPLRFKAVAGVDWVINMWGFGAFTPFAGWAAAGRPLNLVYGLVLLGFCPLFAGFYPLTQIYQFDEDRRRGDRTLALILGMRRSLVVAIAATLLAFACFAAAAYLRFATAWGWLVLAVALAGWLGVLVPWYRQRDLWTADQHQRGFYAALVAWAFTDVAVLVAFGL
jgi:lycopene elongase/hydratase (dihydrobisanhydrobacterioruberin-forming)